MTFRLLGEIYSDHKGWRDSVASAPTVDVRAGIVVVQEIQPFGSFSIYR